MFTLRKAIKSDAAAICSIYNYYVRETTISFDTEVIATEEMEQRIEDISSNYPYIVCIIDEELMGYAYVNKWKARCAYNEVGETTIYLHPHAQSKGIGRALMSKLIESSREQGLHSLIGVIALPNDRSERLHERFGFVKVGHYREVGYKFGLRIDVVDWQLLL